jgi:formate C-acetyltransferase
MEVKQFINGSWTKAINVRDFVFKNITPYYGTSTFLEGPTERTKTLWNTCKKAMAEERANSGVSKYRYRYHIYHRCFRCWIT